MSKLIVVCGATGQLGGSVARRMLNGEGWRVRAITRNVNSQAAQALAAKGAELASADYDDEASLVEVFKVSCLLDPWQYSTTHATFTEHGVHRMPTPSSP